LLYFDAENYRETKMTGLLGGYWSIAEQACNTGFGLLKLSEDPEVIRFVISPNLAGKLLRRRENS